MSQGIPVEETTSDSEKLTDLTVFANKHTFERCIVSTVAKVGEEARKALKDLDIPTLWLDSNTPLPIPTTFPPSMGADRIAAIVGAMLAKPHMPLLIIDAGTCVTYEFIDDEGNYLGGNIAPGLRLRMLSMHEHTALLPLVDVQGEVPLIGYDTDTAMRAGAVLGLKREIEGYIRDFQAIHPNLQVYMTGGDGFDFPEEIQAIIEVDHHLVPKGLYGILEHNTCL